ncbi:MAG: transposase [Legionellaceae bacterium]|nr:transposase [Legionellaceae bacterium]
MWRACELSLLLTPVLLGSITIVGRSRGGLITKIHLVTNGMGKPVKFQLTAVYKADCTQAKFLLEGQQAEAVLADKGYVTDGIVHYVQQSMKAENTMDIQDFLKFLILSFNFTLYFIAYSLFCSQWS